MSGSAKIVKDDEKPTDDKPIEEVIKESQKNLDSETDKLRTELIEIEKRREFDRKVDRIKKSSSATTVAAILPAIIGIFGAGHFYLNRPIDGTGFLVGGILTSIFGASLGLSFLTFLTSFGGFTPFMGSSSQGFWLGPEGSAFWVPWISVMLFVYIGLFIANIVSARFWYSKHKNYIYDHAKRPWDDWGLPWKQEKHL